MHTLTRPRSAVTTRRRFAMSVVALAGVGLAACGSEDDSADPPSVDDVGDEVSEAAEESEPADGGVLSSIEAPCDLVPGSTIEALIGAPVSVEAKPEVSAETGGCNYDPTPDDAGLWRIAYAVGDSALPDRDAYLRGPGLDGWELEELDVAGSPAVRIASPDGDLRGITVLDPAFNVLVDVQGPLDDSALIAVAEEAVEAIRSA